MQKLPNVTRGQLGVAVNGKLTELRSKSRKVMEKRKSDNFSNDFLIVFWMQLEKHLKNDC